MTKVIWALPWTGLLSRRAHSSTGPGQRQRGFTIFYDQTTVHGKFFQLDRPHTRTSTEIMAGLSSFLASAYIIVVNPSILSQAGMPFSGVLTATVLVSFFSTLMMGLYARNPILVAPGMGLNAFFTFTAVATLKVPWPEALGAVFWSGIFFLVLTLFNIRVIILRAIPRPLRYAIAAGIGLFITLIGLVNAGFIVRQPATLIGIGHVKNFYRIAARNSATLVIAIVAELARQGY